MRSWSYKQVTEAAEREIARLAESAKKYRGPNNEADRTYAHWAYGVYLGWSNLTMGWQKDGDDARMQAMAEAVGKPDSITPTQPTAWSPSSGLDGHTQCRICGEYVRDNGAADTHMCGGD